MKKAFTAVIIMIIIAIAAAFPASAEKTAEINLTCPKTAKTGDTIQVIVFFSSSSDIAAIDVSVEFDSDILKYKSCVGGDFLKQFGINSVNLNKGNDKQIKMTAMQVIGSRTGEGKLSVINFEVLKDYTDAPVKIVEPTGGSLFDSDVKQVLSICTVTALEADKYLEQAIEQNSENNSQAVTDAKKVLEDSNSTDEDKINAANKIVAETAGSAGDSSTNIDTDDIDNDNKNPSEDNGTSDKTTLSTILIMLISVGGAIIVVAAAVIIVIVAKNKKKQ